MNNSSKLFVLEDVEEWETWENEELKLLSPVRWKNLISSDKTDSYGIVVGVFEVPPGESLLRHRHAEEEVYYILSGEGILELDGDKEMVRPGMAVFIPGNAEHFLINKGYDILKILYVFSKNAFKEINYIFINRPPK